jgi:hypothetical protein
MTILVKCSGSGDAEGRRGIRLPQEQHSRLLASIRGSSIDPYRSPLTIFPFVIRNSLFDIRHSTFVTFESSSMPRQPPCRREKKELHQLCYPLSPLPEGSFLAIDPPAGEIIRSILIRFANQLPFKGQPLKSPKNPRRESVDVGKSVKEATLRNCATSRGRVRMFVNLTLPCWSGPTPGYRISGPR